MVLDKFKNFLKSREEEEKKEGRRRKEKLVQEAEEESGRSPPSMGTRKRRPEPRESGRRGEGLQMPSERELKELPELPESEGGRGGEERRSPLQEPRPRRKTPGGEPGSEAGGPRERRIPRRPEPPEGRGARRGTNLSTDETLQRILDKLDDIDRRLDRLQRR